MEAEKLIQKGRNIRFLKVEPVHGDKYKGWDGERYN